MCNSVQHSTDKGNSRGEVRRLIWGGTEQSVSLRYILSDNMIHDDDSEHYLNIQTFQQQLRGERRSKEAKNVNKILPRQ